MAWPLIWWRVILGLIASAFEPGLLLGSVLTITTGGEAVLILPHLVFFQLLATVPACLLFGPPLVILYRRMGWESWWGFALGGAAIGPAIMLMLLLTDTDPSRPVGPVLDTLALALSLFGMLGATAALVLRLVVYAGLRPR